MDLDAARKSDCGRDPGLKQTMLHGVTGSRGMSRDVDTTNSRTRAKPVPGPDRNFLTRRGRVKLPHISTCRQTVTVPSLAALRVERQKGRELDRYLASFKKNLKPEKEKMQQVTVAGSRASTAVSESNRKESVKSNTPQKCTTKARTLLVHSFPCHLSNYRRGSFCINEFVMFCLWGILKQFFNNSQNNSQNCSVKVLKITV